MSEHPPVPCPDCKGPLRFREDWRSESFLCDQCGAGFAMPHGWTEKNYTDLWREWTRGMAVVPLPEPGDGTREFWPVIPVGVFLQARSSNGSAKVCVLHNDGSSAVFTAEGFREYCLAGLAAANRAEQLVAEQAKAVKDA